MPLVDTICPVCGYDDLEVPPTIGEICDCCGTEFGYSDFETSYPEIRDRWIKDGHKWWSRYTPKPPNWSPSQQLLNIGYLLVEPFAKPETRVARDGGFFTFNFGRLTIVT